MANARNQAVLIFPHQLFADHPSLQDSKSQVHLVEEPLFFGDPAYPAKFHKQKLAYHHATLSHYAARLEADHHEVARHSFRAQSGMLAEVIGQLAKAGIEMIRCADVHDFVLNQRLHGAAEANGITLEIDDTPGFINTPALNREYREGRKRWFMADFYKWQRKRLGILMDDDDKPIGGQWSFDEDNRKKVPKKLLGSLPVISTRRADEIDKEAATFVEANFPDNPGSIDTLIYPVTHEQSAQWLQDFLEQRLMNFGAYEDAIVENEIWLWHSVLTPMLNVGLLTPRQVVNATLNFAKKNDVPLNSLEGFLRQIIGWREFMRATYDDLGVKMRTTNHWKHTRPLPDSFYDATTGIAPIDDTISRILDTGYCHHIERLMVLGGFMFLCEIDPDDIYLWFMEMFIDAYDWVMVPNVYAMSQNADGGLITTKPYFSGSAYVKKMSNYAPGDWCDVWDGLYWRFIWNHRNELGKNPRWAMMCRSVEKMDEAKREAHLANAEAFLSKL